MRQLLVMTAVTLAAAGGAQAQVAPGGYIAGTIHAGGNHPHGDTAVAHPAVDGALVRLLETPYRAQANERGEFTLGPVPPGTYLLEARRLGFRPTRETVRVLAGDTTRVALHLPAAPITVDAVVVEALVEENRRTYDLSSLQKVAPVGAANLTTVTRGDIREVHARNPWDLVRETTGLEVHEQGQGPGFASDAVIRGFTSDHSADVALVVDGVPINEPINGHGEGYADWNLLFTEALADVQVVKGPISPLFGNFAAGGVVNVTTQASATGTAAVLEGGSHAYTAGSLTTGLERGGWGGFLGAHGARSGGWRDNSGFSTLHLLGRGNRRISPTFLVDAGVQYYVTGWDSPGYLSLDQFGAGQLTAAVDPTDGGDKTRIQGRLSAVFARSSLQWQTVVWGYRSRWHLFLNIPELGGEGEGLGRQSEELDSRTAIGGRSIARWTVGPLDMTVGVEGQSHSATYGIWATSARRRDFTVNRFDANLLTGAALAGVSATLGRVARLEAGLRADVLRPATTDDVLRQPLPAATHTVLGPKFGAVWYARDQLQFYGSAARGFRSAPGALGDPVRAPVVVWALEGGGRYASRRLEASLAFFRLETNGERLFNPVTLAIESDGRSTREGVEAELTVRPLERLAFEAHWTWNTNGDFFRAPADTALLRPAARIVPQLSVAGVAAGATVLHDEPPGERVPAVADHAGRAGVTLDLGEAISLSSWVTVMGPYVPLGEPAAETSPYAITNIRTAIRLTDRLELGAGLDNLFDVRAPELRASGAVNPAAPRTAHLSLRTQW